MAEPISPASPPPSPPCSRCGTCCYWTPCPLGVESGTHPFKPCRFLLLDCDGLYTCTLAADNAERLSIGSGCTYFWRAARPQGFAYLRRGVRLLRDNC